MAETSLSTKTAEKKLGKKLNKPAKGKKTWQYDMEEYDPKQAGYEAFKWENVVFAQTGE